MLFSNSILSHRLEAWPGAHRFSRHFAAVDPRGCLLTAGSASQTPGIRDCIFVYLVFYCEYIQCSYPERSPDSPPGDASNNYQRRIPLQPPKCPPLKTLSSRPCRSTARKFANHHQVGIETTLTHDHSCDVPDALRKLKITHGGFLSGLTMWSPQRQDGNTKIVGPAYTVKYAPLDDPAPRLPRTV